jgi:uncharacterized protein involved in exopolysaccharide biosynthesis
MMNPESQPAEPARNGQIVPATVPSAHLRRVTRRAAASAGPATPSSGGLTPAFFWQVFCKSWTWVIPIGLILAVGAGALVWSFHVPIYEATALVRIEAGVPYIAFPEGGGTQDAERYVQTQVETLRSSFVLYPLLARPEIVRISEIKTKYDPVEHLMENLSVKQVGKSELFKISYMSKSAVDAATV